MANAKHDPAPHGYDNDGIPNTPYGVNIDGTPRKSNRGARAGQRAAGSSRKPTVVSQSRLDASRKEALVGLADMLIATPLAGLSAAPFLDRWIGKTQADALAGDAVLVNHFMPAVSDSLIVLSQSKPGTLAWLDQVEEKAPYIMLASVGIQVAKAVAENHLNPNPRLNTAGRLMVAVKSEQMAAEIEAEARRMGLQLVPPLPPQGGGNDADGQEGTG